jgi:hypothetical protein
MLEELGLICAFGRGEVMRGTIHLKASARVDWYPKEGER